MREQKDCGVPAEPAGLGPWEMLRHQVAACGMVAALFLFLLSMTITFATPPGPRNVHIMGFLASCLGLLDKEWWRKRWALAWMLLFAALIAAGYDDEALLKILFRWLSS